MTHQFETPGANVVIYSSVQRNQRPENQQSSFVDQVLNRVRSASAVVRENITNHYGLWVGIGAACGAAVYLFATDHGRNLRSQVRKTVASSVDTAKHTMTDSLHKVKEATMDVVNKAIAEDDMTETTPEMSRLRPTG